MPVNNRSLSSYYPWPYAGSEDKEIEDDAEADAADNESDTAWTAAINSSSSSPSSSSSLPNMQPTRLYDYYNSAVYNQGALQPSNLSSSSLIYTATLATTTAATQSYYYAHVNQTVTTTTLLENFNMLGSANSSSSAAAAAAAVAAAAEIRQHLCETGDMPWQSWERSLLLFCGLLGALLIAILNLCVIITFIRCAEIRKASQNLYILNLAICDFCVGINSLPGVTVYFFNMCWPFGVPLCQVMTNLDWVTSTETGISMCLIAFDRLLLVRLGALYTQKEDRAKIVRKISISWLAIIVLILAPGFIIPYYTGKSVNDFGDCMNEIYQYETLSTALYTTTGSLPPLMLAIIYVMVYREMTKHAKFNNEREVRRQRRAARGMYFLCAVFLASWIPPTVHELVTSLINHTDVLHSFRLPASAEFRIMTFFKFWIYLNSLVNPFLYASAFPAIRGAMEKTFLPKQWHRNLELRRRLRNSITMNNMPDEALANNSPGGSMRKLRAYARSKTAPIGETLRLLYKTNSSPAGARTLDVTRAHSRDQLNTCSTNTAASTANSSFAKRSTRSGANHRADGSGVKRPHSAGVMMMNGATGSSSLRGEAAAVSHHLLTVPLLSSMNCSDLVTFDPITTTTTSTSTSTNTSRTTTTTSGSDSGVVSTTTVQNPHIDLASIQLIDEENKTQQFTESIEMLSMKSATNTTATLNDDLTTSFSTTPERMIRPVGDDLKDDDDDDDDDGTLNNMSGERMLIVTPQGDLLLRTVMVNGYTTVML